MEPGEEAAATQATAAIGAAASGDETSPKQLAEELDLALDDDKISVASEELGVDIAEKLEAIPREIMGGISAQRKLALWYAYLPSAKADVVDELGGNDSCLVSAEGLILRFASGAEYQKHFTGSPQFLKVEYMIEKLLAQLNEVGVVNLTLIFFDCLKGLLVSQHASLWAFREAFRMYCLLHADTLPSKTFTSWYSPDYSSFVEQRYPFVFIMEDGSALTEPQSIFNGEEEEEEDDSNDSDEDNAALATPTSEQKLKAAEDDQNQPWAPLYALMLDTVSRGINVALLYKFAKSGRRLKAFVVLPTSGIPELAAEARPALEEALAEAAEILTPVKPTFAHFDVAEWSKLNVPFRLALFTACCRENLGEEPEYEGWSDVLCKALILHDFVLRSTPLEERPLRLRQSENETYLHSLEFLFALMSHYLKSTMDTLGPDNYHNFPNGGAELIDLVDETILRSILFAICDEAKCKGQTDFEASFFGIPKEWEDLLDKLWDYVKPNAKFFPLRLGDLMDSEEGFLACEFVPEDGEFLLSDSEATSVTSETTASGDSPLADQALKPEVLPLHRNDYLIQMMHGKADSAGLVPGLMRLSKEELPLLSDFLEAEANRDERQIEAAETETQVEVPMPRRRWTAGDFDLATNHVQVNTRTTVIKYPKWIEQKSGDLRARAIKKWELKREQDSRLYARNINKYFGGLDRLHLPIVLVNGRAATDHPWMRQASTAGGAATGGATETASKKKETAETASKKKETAAKDAKKPSGKAAVIIAKNKEKQAEKHSKKENEKSLSLYNQMSHLFKKKTQRPAVFCEELLQLLVGNRNAQDATVLEDFGEMKKVLTMPENQCRFLTTIAEKLMDPLEHTWRRRQIIAANQVREILSLIGLLFRFTQITIDAHVGLMSTADIRTFQTLLMMLGFNRSARETFKLWANRQWLLKVAESKSPEKDKAKAEKQRASYIKKLEQSALVTTVLRRFDFAVDPAIEATFQVKHLGADMERTLGSISDPRVGFRPDAWQKRLLDCIDRQESCLVVAPTSSGKTYAGYYAMDKGLRFDNECCVLFVSPTRALALQVEAEVVARFSGKGYPSGCKTVLCGHLLEDRQDNWDQCQILITVPSCLEAVLASTSPVMKRWATRLKYAILDEIHCIGEEKAGKDWENLIQLLPCPFIALSATVGNENDFSAWLRRAQSIVPPRPVQFIRHDERYADLQTLYYASQSRGLYELNPLLCLDFERIKSGSLTADFDLIPTDTLQAYEEISAALKAKIAAGALSAEDAKKCAFFVREFDPERFFEGTRAVTKKQYRRYLHSVLTTIERFAVAGVVDFDDINSLIQRIASKKPLSAIATDQWWVDKETALKPEAKGSAAPILSEVLKTAGQASQSFNDPAEFLALIRDLEARRLMPGLVFNFNRAFASRLFYKLAHKLIDEHQAKFYGSPEATLRTKMINKKRQDEYKAILARREMAEKWKTLSKEQREEQGIDEQVFAELTGPAPPPPSDVAEEHDPEFFLCDRRIFLSCREEFDGVIEMCKLERYVKAGRVSSVLLEGLRRGIGLYHDALHREYRRAVELLFRMRYLRIVVSDAALSLGINMPCKSTIFAGDSAMLTPLLYRQTSGRAGRRGFDSLGHVVFWEFPFKKIRRLLCNKLAVLSGGYSVRPTSVLRSMHLANNLETDCLREFALRSPNSLQIDAQTLKAIDTARCKLQKIFNVPLFAVGASKRVLEHLALNTQLSYRFCIDLLRRLNLLDGLGRIEGFATMVMALHDDEPGNLFLVYAIMCGLLRDRSALFAEESSPTDDDSTAAPGAALIDGLMLHLVAYALKRRDCTYSVVERFHLAEANSSLRPYVLPESAGTLLEGPNCSPLLPPLPSSAQQIVETFDRMIFDNAIARAKAICLSRQSWTLAEKQLPMSMVMMDEPELKRESGSPYHTWRNKARAPLRHTFYQSPFAAISGKSDRDLKFVEELLMHCREVVYLEQGLVPQLAADKASVFVPEAKMRLEVPLVNSYAADLLMNGKLRTVIEANDIPASEAYFILQALTGSVSRLQAALQANTIVSTGEYVRCFTGAETAVNLVQAINVKFGEIYAKVRGSA